MVRSGQDCGHQVVSGLPREFGFNTICVMPTNLYGPGDNFDPDSSHVVPALIRRFHEAKLRGDECVIAWGTGTPRREFLHVTDLADAIVLLLERYDAQSLINVGCGEDITIRELCEIVMAVTGYRGRLEFDAGKPDGVPRKLLDVSRIHALAGGRRSRFDPGSNRSTRGSRRMRVRCACDQERHAGQERGCLR